MARSVSDGDWGDVSVMETGEMLLPGMSVMVTEAMCQ